MFHTLMCLFTYSRDEQLTALQSGKVYDVLVIGGGVTGCGVALDSTLRGNFVNSDFPYTSATLLLSLECRLQHCVGGKL